MYFMNDSIAISGGFRLHCWQEDICGNWHAHLTWGEVQEAFMADSRLELLRKANDYLRENGRRVSD